jgi:hypothetical protein
MTAAFLIWSNEHGMWWRENEVGYTQHIDEAGRLFYARFGAMLTTRPATCEWCTA